MSPSFKCPQVSQVSHEPRVIKDLQDTYRKMTQPRQQLRKALKKQAKAA